MRALVERAATRDEDQTRAAGLREDVARQLVLLVRPARNGAVGHDTLVREYVDALSHADLLQRQQHTLALRSGVDMAVHHDGPVPFTRTRATRPPAECLR